jgi:lactoylglutathione lyase
MRYLHSALRVSELDATLHFFCDLLGFTLLRRSDHEKGRYTGCKLAAPGDMPGAESNNAPLLELVYNWDEKDYDNGRNFGHLAFDVDDIYATCQKLMEGGVTINRPPRDGFMAFIKTPDGISLELLQKSGALAPKEPWASMPNTGSW